MKFKSIIVIVFIFLAEGIIAQENQPKKEKFPSYFGFQFRPVFPTRFIGSPETVLTNKEYSTSISQKIGYSFGGTVRAGLTKLIAFETGISMTQRNFDISMSIPDSGIFETNDLSFIAYDVPLNGLVYIQLSEKFYMNASMGVALIFKPTNVGILTSTGSYHSFTHTGRSTRKAGLELNANFGFEYRTEKSGFFYFGGSVRVPTNPIFDIITQYKYQGYTNTIYGEVDGSFLALDFKYFFPNIRNKGVQPMRGPIQ